MNIHTHNIDKLFDKIAQGECLSSEELQSLQISERVWRNCAEKALKHNNTTVLTFLRNNDTIGYFWRWLSKTNGSDRRFLKILPWCQSKDLSVHQDLCAEHTGSELVAQDSVDVFLKFFDHFETTPSLIKIWTKKSVLLGRREISDILIPYTYSSDCISLLSESILSDLPSLDRLMNHMSGHDVGVACGMIAHVDTKQTRIIDLLNSKPESWLSFVSYDNNMAREWMNSVYSDHQKLQLQKYISSNQNTSHRKSKL